MAEPDFTLPALNPFLKLYQAASTDGEPSWHLHNPVANTYYKIAWAEFECLARFSKFKTAQELKNSVINETTLRIDIKDIESLLLFLKSNGLLALGAYATDFKDISEPFWKKILHHYLYFTVPLFTPEIFLNKTLPYIRPFLSRGFIAGMLIMFVLMTMLTLQRSDEFIHSFSRFFSLEGVIQGLIVLFLIKVVHELAHAYTATKFGVSVPHIGIAVIVLYPVLYTETTGSWQLSSRKERFYIGMAGILAEICLATVFLLLWNISPAGSAMQGLAFTVVTISLIGSLLINLNPLMRFDGYYMMSDATGIENLQQRSIVFARYKIRKILFDIKEDTPEFVSEKKEKFLTVFGLCLLVYRFFLFTGIAILVYHMFFKPLGLLLFVVEIAWFVILPIWSEVKIWWEKRASISRSRRARFFAVLGALLLLAIILPWQRSISIPGVIHADLYTTIYPYAPSYIEDLAVSEGQAVKAGILLAKLSSLELDKKISTAKRKLETLQRLRRRIQTDPVLLQQKFSNSDLEIETANNELNGLLEQQKNLHIIAPFDGVVRDLSPEIKSGRFVQRAELLFRLVRPDANVVTGYVSEHDLGRLTEGNMAVFIPDGAPLSSFALIVKDIAPTDTEVLPWPELASVYKGPLATEYDQVTGKIIPLSSLYEITLVAASGEKLPADNVLTGEIRVQGQAISPISRFFKGLGGLLLRESGLN